MAARRKYPWEVWFGQPRTVLVRGVDYMLPQAIMWQSVRNNARKFSVRVRITDAGDALIIDVLPPRTPAPSQFSAAPVAAR